MKIAVVEGHDAEVAQWVGDGLGGRQFVAPYIGVGFVSGERLVAGSVLNDHYGPGSNIEWTHYGPGWLHRDIGRYLGRLTFDALKVSRVTARTRRDNVRVQKLLLRGGFAFEGTQRRFFGPDKDADALVYVLWPEAARERGWVQ